MKNDFLTIPDAPNYEINSELFVRNKKTGHILKSCLPKRNKKPTVTIVKDDGKILTRTLENLRLSAELEILEWVKVPSLNDLYEFSSKGHLRRIADKRLIKFSNHGQQYYCYGVQLDGKNIIKTLGSLFWECHGIFPKRTYKIIPVTIRKDGCNRYFPSLKKCAEFLSKFVNYSTVWLRELLRRRKTEIFGWQVEYHEPKDLRKVKTPYMRTTNRNR